MSAFLIAALTRRSVETRSLSCAFIAALTQSLILSRSTMTSFLSERSLAPSLYCDQRPNGLDQPERPGALRKTVDRCQHAGARERQNKARTMIFERIEDQHRRQRKQAESRDPIH